MDFGFSLLLNCHTLFSLSIFHNLYTTLASSLLVLQLKGIHNFVVGQHFGEFWRTNQWKNSSQIRTLQAWWTVSSGFSMVFLSFILTAHLWSQSIALGSFCSCAISLYSCIMVTKTTGYETLHPSLSILKYKQMQ